MTHREPRVKPTEDAVPPDVAAPYASALRRLAIHNTRQSPLISFLMWLVLAAVGWGLVAVLVSLI